MKKLTTLFIFLILLGCSNENNESNEQNEIPIGLVELNVNIELPENSTINTDDLTISSLFTVENQIAEGTSTVELFDENSMELVYLTNNEGNLVLMSFVNPISDNEIVIDSRTTAQTLAMLHPWIAHLSVDARQEVFEELTLLPEFDSFHSQIIQGINSGEINPLATESILEAVTNLQSSILNRVEEEREPLLMVAEDNVVNVTNNHHSMAYNLQLYDENNQSIGDNYMVDGVNKTVFNWSNFVNIITGNFNIGEPTSVQFPIPSQNQTYNLKADCWEGSAQWKNGVNIASLIVGIVSPSLGKLIKNQSCNIEIGTWFYGISASTISHLSSNEMTASQFIQNLTALILSNSQDFHSILYECAEGFTQQGFSNLLKNLSIIGNFESGIEGLFFGLDIYQYDSEIEFCFEKTENEITECVPIFDYEGTWKFYRMLDTNGTPNDFSDDEINSVFRFILDVNGNSISVEGSYDDIDWTEPSTDYPISLTYIPDNNTLRYVEENFGSVFIDFPVTDVNSTEFSLPDWGYYLRRIE